MHPLHGNPYSLTLISINGHLHSPLIRLVDVRLSSPFLSSPQPPFYSPYSAMSMAPAHVLHENWKSLRTSKVWNNCLACHRGCAWFKYFVRWRYSIPTLYDFVGITFFGHVILRRHDCFVSMLEVLLFFMSIWTFILNHLDLNIHATIKGITFKIMLGSIPHQKFCFYHLPTRGRAGIKLGDTWYVSNVSIIFDCSMLLYYPSWMFYMHLYPILYDFWD